MFHSRIADHVAPIARAHPMGCRCDGCACDRDPIAFNRARRAVRWQAALFVAVLLAFYLYVAAQAPAIAASFEVSL